MRCFMATKLFCVKSFLMKYGYFVTAGALSALVCVSAFLLSGRPRPPVTERDYRLALAAGEELYRTERFEEAYERLFHPAEKGYARARLLLGKMYYYGRGVDRDFKRAYELFSAAADEIPEAGYLEAAMIFRGEVRYRKKGASTDRLKQSAERGYAPAQRDLGMYFLMSGDMERAAFWLSAAADNGDERARSALPAAVRGGAKPAGNPEKGEIRNVPEQN